MSSPSDIRPASSGVLDSPPDGDSGSPLPYADGLTGLPGAAVPGAAVPGGVQGSVPGAVRDADDTDGAGTGSRKGGAHSGRHRARALRKGRFVYPKRRWPHRILVAVNVVVAVMLIGTASVYGYFNYRINQITRVFIPSIAKPAVVTPSGAPMTILVVGSDSRAGDTGTDASQFGNAAQVGGQRSDTIMLVHVDPASTTATLLSIPRDLYVKIPGHTYSDRINSTFVNGPDLLVKAIEDDLGVTIDHYVEVNFQSFRDVVSAVGGIKEYFPTPARDTYSNLKIPAAGCYTMNGQQALEFVRSRHYEYKVNGRWVYEAESDLARIKRQQSFIKKMIGKAQNTGLTNILELNNVIGGVTKNLTLDSGFSQKLLLSLAKRFRGLSPDSLPTATLPTTPAVIGGADVLLLQQPAAHQAIATFLGQGTPPASSLTPTTASNVAPSTVRVAVLNGSGRKGEAGQVAAGLQREGFAVTGTLSANNFNYTSSVIRYLPGNQAKAQLVASVVKGTTQLQEDSSIQGADVELITGQAYQGISTVPVGSAAPTPTPTTATTTPAAPPTTIYELPGTPAGFTPPAC